MKRVLVVDDMPVFAEPIAAALRLAGYETETAMNGFDALAAARRRTPDAILLDVAMPRMDGLTLLEALRGEAKLAAVPVILLTAVTDRDCILRAAKLGVAGYLLKSRFSLAELTARVAHAVAPPDPSASTSATATASASDAAPASAAASPEPAASPAPVEPRIDNANALEALKSIKPITSRSEINDHIEACGELKALSPTVGQLMKLTQSANVSIDRVAQVIKQDQAIALQVLKMANSVVYTRGEPVESLQKAVMRIGLTQIRTLVMNIAVIDRFSATTHPRISAEQFWEHSIATGLIAASVARHLGKNEGEIDAAFTMGLLHDVGRMIFLEKIPDLYTRVMETAEQLELPVEQVETRMLLVNHADLMDKVLRSWRFPKDLIDPIALHHLGIGNIRSLAPRTVGEVATLALANRLAHALLLGSSGNQALYPIDAFVHALKLPVAAIEQITAEIPGQASDIKFAMLSSSNASAWRDLRTVAREQIGPADSVPFHPAFVGPEPSIDAFRILCERLADKPDGDEPATPNIAVAHATHVRDRDLIATRLAELDKAAARRIPLLILSANANILLDPKTMADRPFRALPAPLDLTRFTHAARDVLAAAGPAVATAAA